MAVLARRTRKNRCSPRDRFGMNGHAAVMAKTRFVADARQTLRANGIQISFMQCEVGAAVGATQCVVGARRAAPRTANRRRIMPARLLHREHCSAMAMELLAKDKLRGIILMFALRTGDKKARGHLGHRLRKERSPGEVKKSANGDSAFPRLYWTRSPSAWGTIPGTFPLALQSDAKS